MSDERDDLPEHVRETLKRLRAQQRVHEQRIENLKDDLRLERKFLSGVNGDISAAIDGMDQPALPFGGEGET